MKKFLCILIPLLCVWSYSDAAPRHASAVWFLMERQADKEKQPNDSVVVTYSIVHTQSFPNQTGKSYEMFYPQPHLIVTIRNNTERDVFVDLQTSGVVANTESYPMFTNTTDVTTQGVSARSGAKIGIVHIGGANTEYSTKITQEPRIIHIGENSQKSIDLPLVAKWGSTWKLHNVSGEIQILPGKEPRSNMLTYQPPYVAITNGFIRINEVQDYTEDENPLTLDIRVCYAFDEEIRESFVNKSVFCTLHVLGTDNGNGFAEKLFRMGESLFPEVNSYKDDKDKLLIILDKK